MLDLPIYQTLFLDIETVSRSPRLTDVSDSEQRLWQQKARYWMRAYSDPETAAAEAYHDRAAILAEFGKVVCISLGVYQAGRTPEEDRFRLKSWCGDEEDVILKAFTAILEEFYPDPDRFHLCGHNIREFDVPFLCRRLAILGLPFPRMLQIAGKKPWQVHHLLDTLELWKLGDYKHYISLDLLAHLFGVDSPKTDLDGSRVGDCYHLEHDLDKLARYCEEDVLAVAQIVRRFTGRSLLTRDQVVYAD